MANWYPACICNFLVRYDETLQVVNLPPALEQAGEKDLEDVSRLGFTGTQAVPPDGPKAEASAVEPLLVFTGEADTASEFLDIIPKSCSIELPGYRTAGTFNITVQWNELPIDPRLCRAALVQIYQGTVNPDDFSTGMMRLNADGSRSSVLRTRNAAGDIDLDKLIMVGIVDNWRVQHTSSGSWVMMEGRDLRGLLLDSPVNPKILTDLNYDQPLDKVLDDLISHHPMYRAKYFQGPIFEEVEWPDKKIPNPYDNEIRPSRGAAGTKGKIGVQTGSANYWSTIINLCFRVGAIPYFENNVLKVRPARSVFDQQRPTNPERAPFIDRNGVRGPRLTSNDDEFYVRRFIHGRNIAELNFERKFTGVKVPIIECISTDHSSDKRGARKLLKVQVPSKKELAAQVTSVSPDGLVQQSEKVQIPVEGVRDIKRLEEIAKNLYEEIGQGELGGSIKTKSLTSFLGKAPGGGEWPIDANNADPDLLSMRPGDAVEILVDTTRISSRSPTITNTFNNGQRKEFNEQVDDVVRAFRRRGARIDLNTARVLVASSRSEIIDVLNFFRVYNIRYNWTDGIVDIAFDFHNYFVARYEILEKLGNVGAEPRPPNKTRRKPKLKKERAPLTKGVFRDTVAAAGDGFGIGGTPGRGRRGGGSGRSF